MALRYSVLELSTAVKPWLLRHLMDVTGGPITYLDPDIKVYGSAEPLDDLARRHGVVLTPHNTEPDPARRSQAEPGRHHDRRRLQPRLRLACAPGREVDGCWTGGRSGLLRECRVDPRWGYFVDQRWFDLAPGFLTDLAIVRDPEYNVAYWNLHSRDGWNTTASATWSTAARWRSFTSAASIPSTRWC